LTLVEESTTTIQTRLDQLKREKEQYRKYGKKAEIRALLEGSDSKMLGDVCEFQTYKPLRKKDFIDGEYMVIGGGKKPSGYHNNYNREENTILCSGTGSYAGYISRYNTKVWASEAFSIHSVDFNILNEDYLFLFLVSIQDKLYKSRPASGGQPHMYPKTLQSKIKIPLPSLEIQEQCITLFEQKEAYVSSIDKKIEEHKNNLEELKALAKDVITSFC